jgi:5-methylcytosine-specific restriction endonuclease McrA
LISEQIAPRLPRPNRNSIDLRRFDSLVKLGQRNHLQRTDRPNVPKSIKKRMLSEACGQPCPNCRHTMSYFPGKPQPLPPNATTVEHIHPRALGGGNDDENLTVVCDACNTARGHTYSDYHQTHTPIEVKRITQFLHLQLHDQVDSCIAFPDLHAHFRKHWERLSGHTWEEGMEEVERRIASIGSDESQTSELLRKREQLSRPRKSVGVDASLGRCPTRYRSRVDGVNDRRAKRNRIRRQNATEYSPNRRGIPDSKNGKEEEE